MATISNFTGGNIGFAGSLLGTFNGVQASPAAPAGSYIIGSYTAVGTTLATTGQTGPRGLWFKPDGTRIYNVGNTNARIRQRDLTTPWDITTAAGSWTTTAANLANTSGVAITAPTGMALSNDGTVAFVTDSTANALFRYTLSTPWDITTMNLTATHANTTIYTSNITPQSIWVSEDGLTFATTNSGATATVRVFSTAAANEITSLTQVSSVATGSTPCGAGFMANGNRFFMIRTTDDLAFSYTVSSPFTLTGITQVSTLTTTAQAATPQDMYMKNDGTSFYVIDSAANIIVQYNTN